MYVLCVACVIIDYARAVKLENFDLTRKHVSGALRCGVFPDVVLCPRAPHSAGAAADRRRNKD